MFEMIAVIIIIVVLIFSWVLIMDTHRFIIKNYKVKTNKINHHVRIVVLSDLHSKRYGKHNECLIEEIIKQKPDMICIAGDMLIGSKKETGEVSIKLIEQLAKYAPIYYGNGNHEQRLKEKQEVYGKSYKQYKSKVEQNVNYLENRHHEITDQNIVIYGFELPRKYYKRFEKMELEENLMNQVLEHPDSSKFNILLAHNPDYFEEYAQWGADLSFSGHIHGGLIRIPFLGGLVAPSITFFPKYDGGIYTINDKKMILSRGLGTHTIHLRIFNPGELVVVDIEKT